MSKHIIHKQTVTLGMSNSGDSNLFQDKVSHLLRNEMNDAIGSVFDQVSDNGDVIRIDKLRLDLGIITPANFEAEFKTRLIDELTKVLPKAKSESHSSDTVVLKPLESLLQMLQYFLTNGRLPWYAGSKQIPVWEAEMLEKFTKTEWQKLDSRVKAEYPVNPAIADRLIWQFSDEFIFRFLRETGYHGQWEDEPEQVYRDLVILVKTLSGEQASDVRLIAWRTFFDTAIKKHALADALRSVLQRLTAKSSAAAQVIARLKKTDWGKKLKTETLKRAINDLLRDGIFAGRLETIKGGEITPVSKQKDHGRPEDIDAEKEAEKKLNEKKRDGMPDDNDFIFVHNCGIVMLSPFFQHYFADLKLLDKKEFIDTAAQKRAVLLLHYLATGNNEVAEFDLAFQKILCGLPLSEPVPNVIVLTEKEKEESENMLKAVIRHWKPLNNTSVEGLQTTFLQREGKVKQLDSGWRLQVERKTVDILLDKLPWGYSTIILPWLKYMVHVEWY